MSTQRIHIHIIVKTFHPSTGGLAKSATRIASAFSSVNDFVNHVYITGTKDIAANNHNVLSSYDIKEFIMQPYWKTDTNSDKQNSNKDILVSKNNIEAETNRVDHLILTKMVQSKIEQYAFDKHIIVSFFISTTGFVSQFVADSLNLPHIASIRGGDFSRDLFCPSGMSAIKWVVKRAKHIVTTNNEQLELIKSLFSRNQAVTTIYNSIDQAFVKTRWKYLKQDKIVLISDGGLSFNKATHMLLMSVENLITKGYPLQLNLIGGLDASQEKNKDYWQHLIQEYQNKYPNNFIYYNHLPSSELLEIMLKSHIYVSPTLGEGCSNARLQALAIGIPMVSTRTGELKDIVSKFGEGDHLKLCNPADVEDFTDRLEEMVINFQKGTVQFPDDYIKSIRNMFTPANERDAWEKIIRSLV